MALIPINVAPSSRKTADTFTAGAKSLSQRYLVSPELFAEEQKKIFPSNGCLLGIRTRSHDQVITLFRKSRAKV